MIIPSIDIQNGRAVQLRRGKEFVLDGGDPLERLAEFSLAGEVAVIDLDAAMGTGSNKDIILDMCRRAKIRVGGGIRSVDDALSWLDAGADKIILGTAATAEVCGALPRDRVIAAVDAVEGEVVVEGWKTRTGESLLDRIERLAPYVGGFLLTQVEFEGGLGGFDYDLLEAAKKRAGAARITAAGGISNADEIGQLDQLGMDAQVGMAIYTGQMKLGEAVGAVLQKPITSDQWPTVIVDEDGFSLGLAWSTIESLTSAIDEKKGIYWSRSRNEIWEKGATSGNTQELISVDIDCDRDALRFTVRQNGNFCHLATRSCWGDSFNLSSLRRTIDDRARSGSNNSGTVKLLNDPMLLESKIEEEAGELVAATGPDEVIHEAADLVFFVQVMLARWNIAWSDVIREFERRSLKVFRRPMNPKQRRGEVSA